MKENCIGHQKQALKKSASPITMMKMMTAPQMSLTGIFRPKLPISAHSPSEHPRSTKTPPRHRYHPGHLHAPAPLCHHIDSHRYGCPEGDENAPTTRPQRRRPRRSNRLLFEDVRHTAVDSEAGLRQLGNRPTALEVGHIRAARRNTWVDQPPRRRN